MAKAWDWRISPRSPDTFAIADYGSKASRETAQPVKGGALESNLSDILHPLPDDAKFMTLSRQSRS